jgi:Pyruvate/2-oxoacid:ferredoxin oxidoreductase gamma subunit
LGALFGSGFIRLRVDTFEKTLESLVSKEYFGVNLSAFLKGIDLVRTSKHSIN